MSARSNLFSAAKRPLLCYVTDRHSLPGVTPEKSVAALLKKIEQVADAGVNWVQIREKDLSAKELARLVREAIRITREASPQASRRARILVNDRIDVAIAEGAGGAHLGEKSLPVAEAKRLSPVAEDFLLGVSCHSVEAAQAAAAGGADYIFFGPVFPTPSKAVYGEPQGLEHLAQVCRAAAVPVLAIGGITLENAKSCLEVGAAGIAAIRLFQEADDLSGLANGVRRVSL